MRSFATLLLLLLVGCAAPPPPVKAPEVQLPAWEGEQRRIFADAIDPGAVGMNLDAGGGSRRGDQDLRDRVLMADLVAVVRVQTVSVESSGEESRYRLGVKVQGQPLTKPLMLEREFELMVRRSSASFGVVRNLDSALVGRAFVGFFRRFSDTAGGGDIRFFLGPATPGFVATVQEQAILKNFSDSAPE